MSVELKLNCFITRFVSEQHRQFIFTILRKQKLTENFTCSGDKVVCFGVIVYDSHKELTLNVKLSLPPENKAKLLFFSRSRNQCGQNAQAAKSFSIAALNKDVCS